ncbi:TPA: hypothetical protein N0F65_006259 [Lagenidium giganteum]|uniref:Fe2OG dioxygenase domain-containing protein n=1 Tax=Lagenidium giganteum TaxID=4803 RepID=A0AAV2Z1Y9_9STRA|nr:TPA: hypothetical protein N0F65_006259 [Lagenidium giganteum]
MFANTTAQQKPASTATTKAPVFLNEPHNLSSAHAAPYVRDNQHQFVPERHLAIQLPRCVYDEDFNEVSLATQQPVTNFAASQPFQLLSAEGVKLLNAIVEDHKTHPLVAQSNARAPLFLRGLGFASAFVNGMAESPVIGDAVSRLSGDALVSHPLIMNQGHVNYGMKTGKVVDAWHADSVDYVLVVMLSDPKNYAGGELQIVKTNNVENGVAMIESERLTPQDVLTVRFERAGQAILLRGSKHIHRVMPVTEGGPRLSCILSFTTRNVFAPDLTRYGTFKNDTFAHVEFARHKAWRAQGFLNHLKARALAGTTVGDVVQDLAAAKAELEQAIALITGAADDEMPFYDEAKNKFVKRAKQVQCRL